MLNLKVNFILIIWLIVGYSTETIISIENRNIFAGLTTTTFRPNATSILISNGTYPIITEEVAPIQTEIIYASTKTPFEIELSTTIAEKMTTETETSTTTTTTKTTRETETSTTTTKTTLMTRLPTTTFEETTRATESYRNATIFSTTTKRPENIHGIQYQQSVVVVWEKCGIVARTRITKILQSQLTDGNTLYLWFDPSINSLIFEVSNLNGTSNKSVVTLATNIVDTVFFVFSEEDKVHIYLDCPSTSRLKVSWQSESLKKLTFIELFKNAEGFKNLESALNTYMCRSVVTVIPGTVIHFVGQLSSLSGTLILSFNFQNILFSLSHLNGHLQLISSDGQQVLIEVTSPITSNGFYLVFLFTGIQVFVVCPHGSSQAGFWQTNLFSNKLQIETSRVHQIGSSSTNSLLQSFCTTNNLWILAQNNVTACIPPGDLYHDLQDIDKQNQFSLAFYPNKEQTEKLEAFNSLDSFDFSHLMSPVHRILIASRNNAKPKFFERPILEYMEGFTDGQMNFWIGLDLLNKVTNKYNYKIRVEFSNGNNVHFEEYSVFRVGNLSENFKLTVTSLTSLHGGYFAYNNGLQFSTFNFGPQTALAKKYAAGYWHRTYSGGYENYYCFSCETGVDANGSYHNNVLSSGSSISTRATYMFLIP